MSTVLCVCTYRRPDSLRELLLALPDLDQSQDLSIVVADNDEAGEGAAVCNELPEDYPFQVHALIEPQPGISFARNAVVNKALTLNPELLAFLDDDETPEPAWLAELKRVQREQNADAVGGPTLSVFPVGTAEHIKSNPYYGADMSMDDGTSCTLQAAGNFLIKAETIKLLQPEYFPPEFAHSGGEDLAFFTKLAKLGARMHWAAGAIVHEPVPENRLNPDWIKQRVINIANSRVRVMQILEPSPIKQLIRGLKTVALFCQSTLFSVISIVVPSWRKEAQMLRWKFWGKLTAHLRKVNVRGEGH